MPIYDYTCGICGPFRDWQAMAASGEPAMCPSCHGTAPRAVSAPHIGQMPRNRRIAHERNEKSAHEPRVMSREQYAGVGHTAGHGTGHSRAHGHGHGHSRDCHGTTTAIPALGEPHVQRSPRSWMVGH